ncbi:SDR family oxidoreductase [Streptomyces mirabilis]|uniref:SDR family NAD(P)-dependent oxidoreductase n=1 Tax=Streptomyces mirabilis TaxID=68239 RepID=UPI00331CAAAA
MENRLSGHVALVTGSARGIGATLAKRLADEGAAVAVVDVASGTDTVDAIRAAGGTASAYTADITDDRQVSRLVVEVGDDLGPVDILVNNAGVYPLISYEELTVDEWRRTFAVNVDGVFYTTHAFLPGMKSNGWGRIINVASNSVALQVPGQTHYIASKMALVGVTRGVATEYGAFGVTSNAIAPSGVRTPGTAGIPEEGFQSLAMSQSIKRPSVPDDLAGTVAFLASDDSAFITGQTIYVDGGMVRAL